MKIVAIIQARMGSSRLPNKMMLSLKNKPIIEWVTTRVKHSKLLDDIVVATSTNKENDVLHQYLNTLGIKVFRGSEDNVLNRFYETSKALNATHIVRVCADNPLIDGLEIDNLIEFYKQNPCDYAYNHIPKNNLYPDGLGAEIISFELLEYLNNNVTLQRHKEHCLSYISDNSDKYIIKTFDPLSKELHYPNQRFDIDTFDDYYKLFMSDIHIDISSYDLIKLFLEQKNENN